MMSSYQIVSTRRQFVHAIAIGTMASVATFLLNTVVTEVLWPSVLPLYFGAVVVTVWYWGTAAGLTCAVVSLPGISLLANDPRYALFAGRGGDDVLRLILFFCVSCMVIYLDYGRRREAARTLESQKAVAEQEARLRLAVNVGQMGTWEWNVGTGRITWSHEAAEMHGGGMGVTGSSAAGFLRSVHPEDRDATQLAIARALQAKSPDIEMEYRALLPSGEIRWIEGKGRVIRDAAGNAISVVGVVRDITARKSSEIELKEYAERLQAANTVKDEFLGMVSHELRNPITAILTGAGLLKRRYDSLDDTSRQEVLEDVANEAERLNLIVENLLALAREEFAAGSEPEPVSVNRAIEAIVTRAKKARPSRAFTFSHNGESYISIVPIYFDLVLRNLIDNADKYSPASQPIEVSAGRKNGHVVVHVRDHGPGVPAEVRQRLFERFYRAPGVRSVSGAGIGLSVCQRLLEHQGGAITCDNAPGGGLVVEVRIPVCTDE